MPARAISSAAAATTSRVHGRPASACSAASARSGVAATPPRPILIDSTVPPPAPPAVPVLSPSLSAYATATPEMSSNRRLAILWNAVTGATGSGMRIVLISSSGRLTLCR